MHLNALVKMIAITSVSLLYLQAVAQHSVARQWNEVLLEGIRNDFARPTVHARNLFHSSVLMFDAWAVYDSVATPYLLGNEQDGFSCPFNGVSMPTNKKAAQEEAMSYAMYRLMKHRFASSPGKVYIDSLIHAKMQQMGYDTNYTDVNYNNNNPASLGNYLAQCIINYGKQDGANELNAYANQYYAPINPPLVMDSAGNPDLIYPNNWQPLTLSQFVDQSGNIIGNTTPDFLSPEWGNVHTFALKPWDKNTYVKGGKPYHVFLDPGPPPYMDTSSGIGLSDNFKWTFALVAVWSAHLDTTDGVLWDISPAGIGNIQQYPTDFSDYPNFYDLINGGENSPGWTQNPATGQPYVPQIVPRGDYARVLAEFWADGPDSETPPGHWYTIVNYVNDDPLLQKRWRGQGPVLDDLEWDIKTYFTLGGAMHDAAIAAWSVKGHYDYIRPVSAIRYMADQGQSTDPLASNYSPKGIPLIPGYIETIQIGDALAGSLNENVGKIKLYAWRGPDYITDPDTSQAGVGWILAERWWPYQRSTFVTPPFAGYVSGHSTYSRTAAEVLTMITGDAFFPGGMGEFDAPMNDFLVFEQGPSTSVTLQWATYRDASDQCSLSRIWGGIHPPADDILGRIMGMELGPEAVHFAETYMGYPDVRQPEIISVTPNYFLITEQDTGVAAFSLTVLYDEAMDTTAKPVISFPVEDPTVNYLTPNFTQSAWTSLTSYTLSFDVSTFIGLLDDIDVAVDGCTDALGNAQEPFRQNDLFSINTNTSVVDSVWTNPFTVTRANVGTATFSATVKYNQNMDTIIRPILSFPVEDAEAKTLIYNNGSSSWLDPMTFVAAYNVTDSTEYLNDIDIRVEGAQHQSIYTQVPHVARNIFNINLSEPQVSSVVPEYHTVTVADVTDGFNITVTFNKPMDTRVNPQLRFLNENPLIYTMSYNSSASSWIGTNKFKAHYNITDAGEVLRDIDVTVVNGKDIGGNTQLPATIPDVFGIDMQKAQVISLDGNVSTITESHIGASGFTLNILFDKAMNTQLAPSISFPDEDPTQSITFEPNNSFWRTPTNYEANYTVADTVLKLLNIDVAIDLCQDTVGNKQQPFVDEDFFSILIDPTGMEGLTKHLAAVRLYPNPGKDVLHVSVPATLQQVQLQVFNIVGAMVLNQHLTGSESLDISHLATGMYTYRLLEQTGAAIPGKLVVE